MTGGEIILYAYGAVCIGMLFFNIIYDILRKGADRRTERKSHVYERLIRSQIKDIRKGKKLSNGELYELERKLSRISGLMAFEMALESTLDEEADDPAEEAYLRRLRPVIINLAIKYRDGDSMQAAYFAWMLSRHKLLRYLPTKTLEELMIEYVKKDSIYCRANAMVALYEFGEAASVVRGLETINKTGAFLSDKVLADGLLSFKGDHNELIRLLWADFDTLSDKLRLAVMNYIRFKSGDYVEEMFAIMTDKSRDKELRLSAIRYFGRYRYEPAKDVLIEFIGDMDPNNWEYAAISATSLASYKTRDSIDALEAAIHNSNWYVRYNAAASLDEMDLDYMELEDILNGRDRYAREMLMYRIDSRRLAEEQERQGA